MKESRSHLFSPYPNLIRWSMTTISDNVQYCRIWSDLSGRSCTCSYYFGTHVFRINSHFFSYLLLKNITSTVYLRTQHSNTQYLVLHHARTGAKSRFPSSLTIVPYSWIMIDQIFRLLRRLQWRWNQGCQWRVSNPKPCIFCDQFIHKIR